ncbi:MAG TPA: transporter substrate-binding domain-containing protein [Chloroflexi bacterium]|nr:transporter substrate-binding domain-containing protein [Chloroflexota bacterium]
MKRSHWLILALVIPLALAVVLLTACGDQSSVDGTPTAAPTALPTPSPTPTPLPEGATTAARIRARGTLRVGVRYDLMPFGYITAGGEVAGFGVDVGRELAQRWLDDPEAVQFEQVRSDTAIEHLQAGDVDLVVTALIHSQDREALADFSLPFFIDGHALLVRSADAAALSHLEGLQGRTVGVLAWEDAADALRGVTPFTLTFQVYDRFDGAVAALERGEVDAVAELRRRLFWGQHLYPDTAIVNQYTSASVGFVFVQNDPHFADLVNLTFQELLADGTYAALYSRWFSEYPPPVERWPGTEMLTLADAPVVASVPDTISAIQSRGRLVVAMPTDRSPFAYVDGTGAPVGYEVNLVQRMARRWLGDGTAIEFITTTLPLGREMVRAGQADILLGGLRHTRELELELDFGLTTYWAGEGLLVWAGTPVTDLLDLGGQPVAVVESSLEVLQQAMQDVGAPLTVMPQPTVESAIRLLEGGYAVAVVGDRADLLGPAYATPGMGVLPLRLVHVPVALGLPPGDSAFRDLVNLTLQAMKAEGELDALYFTWFDDAPPALESWPGNPYRLLRLEVAQASEG